MTPIAITPYALLSRFIGVHEAVGRADQPLIQWWLSLCDVGAETTDPNLHDEIAWCSACLNGIFWELDLPRTKSLRARSWLRVGVPVTLANAEVGFDVMILKRSPLDPGPDVLTFSGHVTLFGGFDSIDHVDATAPRVVTGLTDHRVLGLGGNQGNRVSIESFPVSRILGIRRVTRAGS